uniref:Protein kinase domain-containing protein n=1 Tax=Pristionchus pacificus TaxID=54126 RepID=A0A2A6CVU1_PRIPA|eukprot:PDM82248.1 protein kinase [Pristionchus pacificus]
MKLWFKQIVPAVAYIHVKKLLHRDLKPSNILISEDGRLKVCDLGIASEQRLENGMEVVVTRTYKSCTELYRSPEQVFNCYRAGIKADFDIDQITVDKLFYSG